MPTIKPVVIECWMQRRKSRWYEEIRLLTLNRARCVAGSILSPSWVLPLRSHLPLAPHDTAQTERDWGKPYRARITVEFPEDE